MSEGPILSQGVGYGVVCGIGIFFSAFMVVLTWVQGRYTSHKASNSEEFTSASRSVKPGLIAAGVVSAWTWAATLLQSSAVAYKFGVSGPFWYAAGATVQVLLFAQLAAKLKLNAPFAHTFLEIIGKRWGNVAHMIFTFFGLATNIIVSSMLILGGSATVTDLTGMSTLAACFLIPLGVAIYVMVGGMRATLLCDYTHTTILFVIILLFGFTVWCTSPTLGSITKVHDLLTALAEKEPIAGNAGGTLLTFRSKGGIIFGAINIVGNFATVFNDQAYWQRAVASEPQSAVKAYLLGGVAWFSIPFFFACTMGLAARALNVPLTAAEVSAGLPAPAAASALLGSGGAAAMLVLLFLAVTSATSAEMVAVSSILTYDVYKRYFNPKADEEKILKVSQYFIALYAVLMGVFGLIFFYIGISMGWLYECMGTLLGSAVVPIALCITWRKANKIACCAGAVGGLALGIMAWLVTAAKLNNGALTVDTTGQDYPMLTGNLVALGVGGIISLTGSFMYPEDFDFNITRTLNYKPASSIQESSSAPAEASGEGKNDKDELQLDTVSEGSEDVALPEGEIDFVGLNKAFKFAFYSSVALAFILIIVIPFPLFFSQAIYDVKGLSAWVICGFIWTFAAAFIVVIYPLYESRVGLAQVLRGITKDIFTGGKGAFVHPEPEHS